MSDDEEDYNYDEEDFELAESEGYAGRVSVGDLSALRKSTSSLGAKSNENKTRKSAEMKSSKIEVPKEDNENDEDFLSDGMDLEKYIMDMKIIVPQPADVNKTLSSLDGIDSFSLLSQQDKKAVSSSRSDLDLEISSTPRRSRLFYCFS